ncbi:hypothetical protein QL285_050224 [Trifolium repens]|nr:hypothetical protein QL285_050224 [Trifolium repens]
MTFVGSVMCSMNIMGPWRWWIMECVSSVTTSILVNGNPTDEFRFERGLQQRDPLSPFLFLIVAEGLNAMMSAAVELGLFAGFQVGYNLLFMSHLQFADDTLIIVEKSWANIRTIKIVLLHFELMSDLKVNFHKSLLVGVNVTDSWLEEASSGLYNRGGIVPFMYFDILIGSNLCRMESK